jgi:hypothetical protein
LNSERIRQQFGSFGIDVIESTAERRISSLYSLEDGRKVCRTYALVEFRDPIGSALAEEHALVLSGQSIGAVFKARGWTIAKRHTRVGNLTLTHDDKDIARPMRLEIPLQVALHSYVFEVKKHGAAFDYAAITEIHHPEYLTEADLQSIYGEPRGNDRDRTAAK